MHMPCPDPLRDTARRPHGRSDDERRRRRPSRLPPSEAEIARRYALSLRHERAG